MKAFCTKSRLLALGYIAALGLWGAPQAFAADEPEAAITVKTAVFEILQTDNLFSFCIDVDEPIYLDVDCGYGPVEYEIEPSQDGTWFPCKVTPDGTVTMYTDKPEVINYLYCQGGHITEIDLSKLTALQVLDLGNNDLKKIDLSNNGELEYIDLGSNPFDEEPLYIGKLPKLKLLEVELIGNISPDFELSNFPELLSFSAFSTKSLTHIDPSACPKLQRISVDVTSISSIDVTNNPELRILNIGETFITSVDVSKNTKLEQLYITREGTFGSSYKFDSLDITNNPQLVYLFAQSNNLKTLDISKNPLLEDLQLRNNYLETFDCSANPRLSRVSIANNCLDFATLPLDPLFSDYYYQQRPMPVARSYPVGAELDLSKRVLREGTITDMLLYAVSEKNINEPLLLSDEYYDYDEGVIKFKKEYPDSVYASFVNSAFPECILTTDKFLVKSQEQFGTPVATLRFSPTAAPGSDLAFGLGADGASDENPRTVFVDFGDGTLVPVTITCQVPDAPNVAGRRAGVAAVKVYVNDGDNITGLSIDGCSLYDIDLEKAPMLRSLSLTGTGLSYIDLTWQRCLESLTLTGNNLEELDLTTEILGYRKNVLRDINVSDNGIYDLKIDAYLSLKHLNVSHNNITELDISKAYFLKSLDISYNDFVSIETENLDSLETLNVAGNRLTHIGHPWQNTLRNLDCRYNPFTFATLPYRPGELEGEYIYAPQNGISIVRRGPSCRVPDVGLEVDGVPTEFVWRKEDGSVLIEGTDYTASNGSVEFKDFTLGKVYCSMTNAVYPELTLVTSEMLVDEPPTKVLGWMDVADKLSVPADIDVFENNGMYLSAAANHDGGTFYIDWGGDGKIYSEYLLGTTYRFFELNPVAGRRAVIYSYEDEDPDFLSVFSLNGVPLKGADFSKLTSLNLFAANYAGCPDMILPDTDNLESLGLSGNRLTSIDPSRFKNLKNLYGDYNKLTKFDLSAFPSLQYVTLIGNGMSDIKIDNPYVWNLNLEKNEFEHFSLEGLPSLHQVFLSANRLKSIDINGPKLMRCLYIEDNCFDFQTLPVVPETVTVFRCLNQAPIPALVNGLTVDLSSQAERNGVATTFYWCVDEPYYDSTVGSINGSFLTPGTDYTINNGVTTFNEDIANVCCVMVNDLFPRTYLVTDLLTLTSAGVDAAVVSATAISVNGRILTLSGEEGTHYGVYTTDGKTVATGSLTDSSVDIELPAAGIYVVKAGNASMKVAVK